MFNDRYILASSLQKSIRRGLFDYAKVYANLLADNDYNYLIYRLGIILTEDIGVSNTSLLNEYLDLKISKKAIEEKGGKEFLFSIIEKACLSVKDRSSCDIAYFSSHLTDWAIQKPEFQKIIRSKPDDRLSLINEALLTNINPALKVNLIWGALGQRKYPNELLSSLNLFDFPKLKNGKNDDSVENFLSILKTLELSNEEISAVINAHATQNEFICLGMAITYKERTQFIRDETLKDPQFTAKIQNIDFSNDSTSFMNSLNIPIVNAAIDHHTSQGKAAYTMFCRKNGHFLNHMKAIGINENIAKSLLPFFMFRIEGHEVNKREYFKFAVTAMTLASQVSFNRLLGLDFNNNQYSFKDAADALKKDIPIINQFREKSLNFNSPSKSENTRKGFNI